MDVNAAKANLIRSLEREISDPQVLAAMSRVPRERFVPPMYIDSAYDDRALPIGFGQTISQPLIVALMTQALALTGSEKVLEIGTGSGYQSAILAEMADTVISIERIPELAERSRELLKSIGYTNITIHTAIETLGWTDDAPYDAIIVTAGAPAIPDELLLQLAVNGKLVIPVGNRDIQELYKITKHENGTRVEQLGGCLFVPLIGKGAWENQA